MSDWNPSEEFKTRERKMSTGNGDAVTSVNFINPVDPTTASVGSRIKATRIKTLARATRYEMLQVKADLKFKLPVLMDTEVRRHRIPHCDSVILELEEEGFRETAEYMCMLFELDEEMRKTAGPGSIVWKKPRLKSQQNFLDQLRSGLTAAEIAKRSGKLLTQATSLLDMALFFDSKTWEWFWIAEQLFRSSLKVAENIQSDEGRTLNAIRYLFGRFLFNKMNDPQEALPYLDEVRVASEGKIWNASKILGIKQETLYTESCVLLHKSLLAMAEQVRTEDPEMSVRSAVHALERAKDSVHDEYVAAALIELAKSQMASGNVKLALGNLLKFLAVAKRIPDPESVCTAHLELAFARKELNDSEGTVKHLALLRECATRYKLPYKLAQAHYYTGEYLLNKSQASLATPHLELALSQFNILGKTAEANRARCTAGVSKGQEVTDRYTNLILECESHVTEATTKICLWKSNRVPFWTSNRAKSSTDRLLNGDLSRGTESINISESSASSPLSKSLPSHITIPEESKEVTEIQKTNEESPPMM